MTSSLPALVARDARVWDDCAPTYEQRIVGGHPDVLAYEAFEEDLIDRVLRFLARPGRELRLYDVGCGSGRLHLRYGLQVADESAASVDDAARIRAARATCTGYAYDPALAGSLVQVGGIDFSRAMLALARGKTLAAGLAAAHANGRLRFDEGSAFSLPPLGPGETVYACCCNSIGVMQGPEGAVALFDSLRRAVDLTGGVAIISAYRRDAVERQALGNYESTMDVCGRPLWLVPDEFPAPRYRKVPRAYKRADDPSDEIVVDVVDHDGAVVHRDHRLRRDPNAVADTIRTGRIRTETDYESRWYDRTDIDRWIAQRWGGRGVRLDGSEIDALRARPVQLAIYDPGDVLTELLLEWRRA